jgi:ankyrin repeat protein
MSAPRDNDPIITQFQPEWGQWELNDENIQRIDPENGETILHNYYKYINSTPLEMYRYLIETKGCKVDLQNYDGDTPLHFALDCFNPNYCDMSAVNYLLNHKDVNFDVKGRDEFSLLHSVCHNMSFLSFDVLKLLIEIKSCDVNLQNSFGNTPIHYALCYFKPGDDITVLTYLLDQKNVNVNTKGHHDYTLLHYACLGINRLPLDIFKYLIETKGGGINIADESNNTPLHLALQQFNPEFGGDVATLTYLLTQKGVNFDIVNQYGHNLLHLACISDILDLDDFTDSDDDLDDDDDPEAEADTFRSVIIEFIVERCVQQVLDDTIH